MIQELTYKDANGKELKAAYASGGSVYALTAKREVFAQLCAQGVEPRTAFCQSHDVLLGPDTIEEIKASTSRLLNDTTVVLRIQELKRPILRKLAKRIEYGLNKALEQCQVAYDLAYANGDVKGLLAAIRMQAELAKLLGQEINVNHRHGLLDDTSTEVLLAMKKQIEDQRAKAKKTATVEGILISDSGKGA